MPPTEAQKQSLQKYRASRTRLTVYISEEVAKALDALAKVHGSKVKAVEAAVLALAKRPEPYEPPSAEYLAAVSKGAERRLTPQKPAEAKEPVSRGKVEGKTSKAAHEPSGGLGVPVPTYVRRDFNPQPKKSAKPKPS
jgi:hypothetical protein